MRNFFILFTCVFLALTPTVHADSVICIHGFLTTCRSMKPIKNALQCSGHNILCWQYPSRQKFIEEHACDLVIYLQKIACQSPGIPIHFVSHSIGALVLRAALNIPSCPQEAKIGRAVLITPPNQGSSLARRFQNIVPISTVMGNFSGWQLMHYSPSDMHCIGEFPETVNVLIIAGTKGNKIWFSGPNDGFLAVEEMRLNTPAEYLSFHSTHGDILKKRAALYAVKRFLLDTEPCQ